MNLKMGPLWETTFLEVNPLSPSDRFMIARHSPGRPCEVGLPIGSPEKGGGEVHRRFRQSVLSSPSCLGIIAKYGHISDISATVGQRFSAVQTAWRCVQSGANLSPPNSLLTGKNTGNLPVF